MSTDYFYTIPGMAHTKLLSRVWDHPGVIVDLGCASWDWSGVFLGKKRVVGADPMGSANKDAELWNGLVGPFYGDISFLKSNECSSAVGGGPGTSRKKMVNWKIFSEYHLIDQIAALKINIEGGEWPLLASMDTDDFAKIDQLAVSFHDWRWPGMEKATKASLFMLGLYGFHAEQICPQYGWWLFTKAFS